MRLADFILANTNAILAEWDVFAREIWPEAEASQRSLRDHAEEILRAAARDMQEPQTRAAQHDKAQGQGQAGKESDILDDASLVHARSRVDSGFSLPALVAEYRALRASVVRLWGLSGHAPDQRDLVDLTRFNETIDQSLAEAVRGYTLQVDRARRMFHAILAHDLRTPLNAIVVSAECLTEAPANDPDIRTTAQQIAQSAHAMARMLGDFLDFAQTQLGKNMPIAPVRVDLGQLCTEVVAETKAAHPQWEIHFDQEGDTVGHWDPARLRQVVSNLLGNAVQHGTTDTPINVILREEPAGVLLTVANIGAPIPPELLPRIFQPMVRGLSAESRATQRLGSMGLGLYIAREVITAHAGAIDVTSSSAGLTTFSLRLPRQAPAAAGRGKLDFPTAQSRIPGSWHPLALSRGQRINDNPGRE
jgi:signal transduction histidine kinase